MVSSDFDRFGGGLRRIVRAVRAIVVGIPLASITLVGAVLTAVGIWCATTWFAHTLD